MLGWGVAHNVKQLYDLYNSYPGGLYNYMSDLHPSETQFKHQKQYAGANPLYDSWMRGRAEDEWARNQRAVLGISWSDIRSPWIATLSGGNGAYAMGRGVGSGMNMVSKNINQLYGDSYDGPRLGQSEKAYRKDKAWKRRKYHI